ncbi:hypothetical protein [Chthonobacter rhizosphaerae]|uniref:hypothetical protein n=1 Tax=Chthonobacter rhizosphaerae TaxID=2735553 RepID=UPI0015EE6ADD
MTHRSVAEIRAFLRDASLGPMPARGWPDARSPVDVVAAGDLPPADTALGAGWAVSALSTVGASPESPLPLDPPPVPVAIGDALPEGRDAVAPREAVEIVFDIVSAVSWVGPFEAVRRRGGDARAGQTLLPAGAPVTRLRHAALVAASLAPVSPAAPSPRVQASTVAPPPAPVLDAAKVLFSNTNCDILVSADPERDTTALVASGASLVASRLALRPGADTAVVVKDDRPIVVTPARFDAMAAIRMAILDGGVLSGHVGEPAPLAGRVASAVGMTEIVLLRREHDRLKPIATGDWTLAAVLAAESFLILPPESEGLPDGSIVAATSLMGDDW